jgi:RepB DNA-primase from phage plasmid
MLDAFASVGATHFNVTWTTLQDEPRRSRKGMSIAEITRALPAMLDAATRDQLNLIMRPYGPDVWFIQLDDLKTGQLARLAPRIFLILETSPGKHAEGNYQAWLALEGSHDKEFARRVRRGAGTDKRATGATRIAGSLNFKEKYAPDFPRVTIHTAQPGRKVTAAELEQLGLVAPPEEFAPFTPRIKASSAPSSGSPNNWPSYQMALDRAPLNGDGTGPDRSNADLKWAMTAIGLYRRDVKETAARLMEESAKAKQKRRGYADMIADTAAKFVAQRQQQPRQRVTGHRQG